MSFSHVHFPHRVSDEVRKTLFDLYQSPFCVTEYLELFLEVEESKAVAIHSGKLCPDHLILYSISGNEAIILNEFFEIDAQYLNYLVGVLFDKYPKLHTIHIDNFKATIEKFSFLHKMWGVSQDNVVELPETMAEYRRKLGKRTKANLSNYSNKLRREFPDFMFSVTAREKIDVEVIRRIIKMHRSRMLSKKSSSAIDADHEKKIIQFAQKYGIVGAIYVNGHLAAGTICYKIGNHCYADVLAHDQTYNKYSIGRVCVYLMIKALIERGLHFFHMGSGEADYKNKMLCVKHDVYHVSIFRTKLIELIGTVKHAKKNKFIRSYVDMIKYNYILRFREIFLRKLKAN